MRCCFTFVKGPIHPSAALRRIGINEVPNFTQVDNIGHHRTQMDICINHKFTVAWCSWSRCFCLASWWQTLKSEDMHYLLRKSSKHEVLSSKRDTWISLSFTYLSFLSCLPELLVDRREVKREERIKVSHFLTAHSACMPKEFKYWNSLRIFNFPTFHLSYLI